MVWNDWDREIGGVCIGNPDGQPFTTVRPTGRLTADFRQAFAQFLAENLVAAIWPGPSAGLPPPASSTESLTVAEDVLDPRLLVGELVRATVQVAAIHAGIPLFVARVMGQVAKEAFVSLLSPDPDAPEVQAVRFVDLTLSAKDGSLINSPALHEIAVSDTADVINKLLGPEAPKSSSPASAPRPASSEPARPARQPGPPRSASSEPARPAARAAPRKPIDPAPPPRAGSGHESGPRPKSPPAPSPGHP